MVNFPSYPAAQNSKRRSNMACPAWLYKGRFHPGTQEPVAIWAPNPDSLDLGVVLFPQGIQPQDPEDGRAQQREIAGLS